MPLRLRTAIILTALLIATTGSSSSGAGLFPPAAPWQSKVDPWVLHRAVTEPAEFLMFLTEQADLSAAARLPAKLDKGRYVYETLSALAARTQEPVLRDLEQRGVAHQSFWVANMIWVRGDVATVQAMAARADVAHIYANPTVRMAEPAVSLNAQAAQQPNAVEWNIAKVHAPDVWAAGFTGQGGVIGGQDTGYQWDHPALKRQYRGWEGTAATHDYNWHDAIHSGGGVCGADSPFPCDDYGHGTHTMGTIVGDDSAGNQIGVAPGARWIGCRNMNVGDGTPATYSECYQWFIAPTKLDGSMPNPAMAPDVINNSWGCTPSEGCTATNPNVLLAVVHAVRAAGIVTVHSAGNSGPGCNSINEPAAIYAESFTVGATNSSDAIAGFSSRGPVTTDGSNRRKPDVVAPGVGIRSSVPTSTYAGGWSGTSMAGPHIAGTIALLISAYPWLAGNVDAIESIIEQSAVDLTTTQLCGDDTSSSVPNNVFGWGRIDALAAYDAACSAPGAVNDVAISIIGADTVQLSWTPVLGATSYEVWSATNEPYFTPPPDTVCASNPQCAAVLGTTAQTTLGGPTSNYSYVVLSSHRCGATTTDLSKRMGEFAYSLVPGE
jgi:serine protease AprX